PGDRPTVAAVQAWLSGEHTALVPAAVLQPEATIALLEPATVPGEGIPVAGLSKRRALPLIAAAVIVLALGWVGARVLSTRDVPTSPATEAARDAGSGPSAAIPAPALTSGADATVSMSEVHSEVHQEIPDVPL